jgi:hypothetical protein
MVESDPYWKLRPALPTPPAEICSCIGAPPLLLRSTLGPNPLACASCNLEVPPERLGISAQLAESLASWRSFHDCFYILWLDSAEFEEWARLQLSNPGSPVNARGLELRAELEQVRRTYFWWFQDPGAEDFVALASCPICHGNLWKADLVGLVCNNCSLLVAN